MRTSKLVCGCGYYEVMKFDQGNKEYEGQLIMSILCHDCDANDKMNKGYDKSPHWKYPKQEKLSKKTLDFLARGAQEAAQKRFEGEFGDKPMTFTKKKKVRG